MRRTWGTRLVSLVIAGAMIASVPLGAFAGEYDLSKGDIDITVKDDAKYIKQKDNSEDEELKEGTKKDTDEKVTIKDGDDGVKDKKVTIMDERKDTTDAAEITFEKVYIDNSKDSNGDDGRTAVEIKNGEDTDEKANIQINVEGENTIKGDKEKDEKEGEQPSEDTIDIDEGASLTIKTVNDKSSLTIEEGNIDAEEKGASFTAETSDDKTVTISGADITAKNDNGKIEIKNKAETETEEDEFGNDSAYMNEAQVDIYNGSVNITKDSKDSALVISGEGGSLMVRAANDDEDTAAIGTGHKGRAKDDDSVDLKGSITIKGNVSVDATGGNGTAGIGTAKGHSIANGGSIIINTLGLIVAKGGSGAAGIGTGAGTTNHANQIAGTGKINITVGDGGFVITTGGVGGAGIGTGENATAVTQNDMETKNNLMGTIELLVKKGGNLLSFAGSQAYQTGVETSLNAGGAGIGTGKYGSMTKDSANGHSGQIKATTEEGGTLKSYNYRIKSAADHGAAIGTGLSGEMDTESSIELESEGVIEAYAHGDGAGIGTGYAKTKNSSNLWGQLKGTIRVVANKAGNILATGLNDHASVGIGSGISGDIAGGKIEVVNNGSGTIKAKGAYAGIGTGWQGDITDAKILINNTSTGSIIANGGTTGVGSADGASIVNSEISVTNTGTGNIEATGGTGIGTGSVYGTNNSVHLTNSKININGTGTVIATGGITKLTQGEKSYNVYGAGVGVGAEGIIDSNSQINITESVTLIAKAGSKMAASIGAGSSWHNNDFGNIGGQNNGTTNILNTAKVILGVNGSDEAGYIGSGKNITNAENPTAIADGDTAKYVVDCTTTITDTQGQETAKTVEETYRESMTTKVWKWGEDYLGKYIHFTPSEAEDEAEDSGEDASDAVNYNVTETPLEDGRIAYTNGSLTINCHDAQQPQPEQPIDQTNTGVIASTDPIAAQRWYWVTALFDADENVGYTYQQIGSNLIVTADEQAYGAVLHVLLSGWAEHTEVQSITFVTAGKTTTIYASDMLGITTGEQLTLTHDYDKATLAVEGRDYTYLLGEAVA